MLAPERDALVQEADHVYYSVMGRAGAEGTRIECKL
jgi:hypothetical protein